MLFSYYMGRLENLPNYAHYDWSEFITFKNGQQIDCCLAMFPKWNCWDEFWQTVEQTIEATVLWCEKICLLEMIFFSLLILFPSVSQIFSCFYKNNQVTEWEHFPFVTSRHSWHIYDMPLICCAVWFGSLQNTAIPEIIVFFLSHQGSKKHH